MQDSKPDNVQELIHVLREQIDRKDERIASLESLLQQTNQHVAEQHRMLASVLRRQFERIPGESPTISDYPSRVAEPVAIPEQKQLSGEFTPAISHEVIENRVKLPDLGPQIEVIANAVVAAGARKAEMAEVDVEDGHDTAKLLAAQASRPKPSRGLKFWKRRERATHHV